MLDTESTVYSFWSPEATAFAGMTRVDLPPIAVPPTELESQAFGLAPFFVPDGTLRFAGSCRLRSAGLVLAKHRLQSCVLAATPYGCCPPCSLGNCNVNELRDTMPVDEAESQPAFQAEFGSTPIPDKARLQILNMSFQPSTVSTRNTGEPLGYVNSGFVGNRKTDDGGGGLCPPEAGCTHPTCLPSCSLLTLQGRGFQHLLLLEPPYLLR